LEKEVDTLLLDTNIDISKRALKPIKSNSKSKSKSSISKSKDNTIVTNINTSEASSPLHYNSDNASVNYQPRTQKPLSQMTSNLTSQSTQAQGDEPETEQEQEHEEERTILTNQKKRYQ